MYRLFENLVNPFSVRDHGTPPATLMAFYLEALRPFRRIVPWLMLTGLIVALIEAGMIWYTGRLIDIMTTSGAGQFWATYRFELILVAIGLLLIRPVAVLFQHALLELSLAGNMQERVRWRSHRHMLGQSVSFFQNDFAGRLSNRVMKLSEATEDTAYMVFEGVWYALAYALAAIILVSGIDWRVAVPLVIWLAAYIAYTWWTAVRVASASEKWSNARSMVNGRIVDAYTNIETVKLFAHGKEEEAFAQNSLRRLRLRFQRFLRLMTELSFGLTMISGVIFVGVVGTAVWLWTVGQGTVGEVAAVTALAIRLNGMSGWIMWVTVRLFEHAGTVREGLESVAVDHAVVDQGDRALAVSKGLIEFRNLTHHYGKGRGGLEGVSLTIEPGEKVGLVGRSGAGKSSLVNLLLRFRDPEGGAICIDGQDISGVTQDSLRDAIGMVTQDSSLLHRSIRANILYGNPDANEQEMIEAARRAEAHEFIQTLEDPKGRTGYNAYVGERGVKLSGGQRQRVAIARVILKDAPILVLDEATSALDSEVEAAIQNTLYGMMEGKTVIAIAHRLSTIAHLDRIIVLDQGRMAEEGTHSQLLAKNGLYAGFWHRQSGGFLGVEEAAE
jgi:ATP-binding cassette subfamily B multidrug efflux pump